MGDRVIDAGGELQLHAGQRLVIEGWNRESPVYFTWDALRGQ
jgi:hypothetical protein